MYPSISPKQSFPALESDVLTYWKANNTFQKSIDSRPEDNPYRFYDGPPFITGTPHYGSLLSSIVKDVIGRYWTMRGRRVDRVWGWDCHGLPIEEKVQKKLGLSSNKEIEERGVKEFIDGCYEYTASTSAEWGWYVDKIGRWVDMEHAYRTMDQDYMESVMWVFQRLWEKGLIYEGKRVSLYSWKLGTPISNFEVAMDDTYQEVNDPAVTVKFRPEFTYAAFAFLTNNEGKVLLGKHKKSGVWKIPGGKFEQGETREQCLEREVFEETGLKIKNYTHINTSVEFSEGIAFYGYAYTADIGEVSTIQNPEPDKFDDWKFFSRDELRMMKNDIAKYDHEALEVFLGERESILEIRDFSLLAWTTTPWTIPANMALAVRNDIDYMLVESDGEQYIVAKNRAEPVFKGKGEYSVIREIKGSDLVGLGYVPPFPEYYYQKNGDKNHRIYHADFITDTDGTGIGHEAPEFGDVDFQLAKKEEIFISEAMDEAGKYTSQIFDYEGTHYQDANKINIERMKENGTLFKNESITHRVPFCPRSGTPLVQKAQASWFIDIQSQKEKLLEANKQINWFPDHFKFGRFAKGIESAPDWCISRTRYWGAPMPVWQNADASERVVVASREEIFELNKPYGQLTKLIITRHAESQANVDKHYDDVGNSPLSQNGEEQAKTLMSELANTGVDIIITSPFLRAVQTAGPLAKKLGIEIITDDRLRETDHGKMANAQSSPEVKKERSICFFGDDKSHKFAETGESYNDILARTTAVIEDICAKYPGKTVLVVSHGFPTGVMSAYLRGKKIRDEVKNATTETFILDVANKKQLNLHRPYIDSILLKPTHAKKAQKVLGVHGWMSDGLDEGSQDFWLELKSELQGDNIDLVVPNFDKNKETKYTLWREKIDTLNVEQYDTVVAHSFGCPVMMQYIIENKVELERLVLVAPSGLVGNTFLEKLLPEFTTDKSELKKYVKEIVILHSKDDGSESAPYSYGKSLSEDVGATLITVDGYNHDFLGTGYSIIAGLVRFGPPLTRIPEVLDVWMDSGSMPYAQMHYPFENQREMQTSFPADFIAEYVGQIRAWFYVMHVLGVLVNPNNESTPTPSFTNVITTGVINGNDGRKMSKSYGNYPDPRDTIEKYGADPIRFYMLNSPLLSGGDMDFKEEGIIETIKTTMLPLWNTYSFFTTYANIDNWEKDETEIWFSRHAESESNVAQKMSDGNDNPNLTEKGRVQAQEAGKILREQGKNFDIILHTDRIRARDTAQIIGDEIGFSGEYIICDGFAEQTAGEYANKTLSEIVEMNGLPADVSHVELRKLYKNNSVENIEQFEQRILQTYEEILQKYHGKKILIVAHSGTPRPILHHYMGMDQDQAHYDTNILNAIPFQLMTNKIVNPLDRWILSRLQVLIGQVHDAMDGYDISRACRMIVSYMDELTNWYVRLSRRRFWGSEMTDDKISAYETLYAVLAETSKLLAPYMPFMAEDIFRGLTQKESVHLEYITRPNLYLLDNSLNHDMQICEQIVSLGLALRSRKNIRVRQPLQSITITQELSEYYQGIIRDELNVKEVLCTDPEKLAKKICKPDARKIGPKYGKDVQKVIAEAKSGNFLEKENGVIDVAGFILEGDEYTLEYIPLEGVSDVEGGYGMVISIDTTITEDLQLEGYARDIIRQIQDMRKEADYQVTDRISLHIAGHQTEPGVTHDIIVHILESFGETIEHETLSSFVPLMTDPDLEKILELDTVGKIIIQVTR